MPRQKTGLSFHCRHCGDEFYRPLTYLQRTPNPPFCGISCRDSAIKAGTWKSGPPPGERPYRKTGVWHNCVICQKPFYRRKSYDARGINKTCGDSECKSKYFSGENNPFWGKDHTNELKEKLSKLKTARPNRPGPPKGYKHTPEARAKISEALRQRWLNYRDGMLSLHPPSNKPREDQRYRKNFTPLQKKEWKSTQCCWCGSNEKLELDHIVPVAAGGINAKQNAQTLCRSCNMWKMVYIDRPMILAMLAIQSG